MGCKSTLLALGVGWGQYQLRSSSEVTMYNYGNNKCCTEINKTNTRIGGGVILPSLGYTGWGPQQNVEKRKPQNGLRMLPELLPHQLRSISAYPIPPISHVGKIEHWVFFDIFPLIPYYSLQHGPGTGAKARGPPFRASSAEVIPFGDGVPE